MPRFFIGLIPDNLILIPTVAFNRGRCPVSGKVVAERILILWLNVEAGLELDFFQ